MRKRCDRTPPLRSEQTNTIYAGRSTVDRSRLPMAAAARQRLDYYSGGCTETYEDFYMGCVHFRDVALAHILVYENKSAAGRHMCLEAISHYGDFAAKVAGLYPEYKLPGLPKDTQPGLLREKSGGKKLMDLGLEFIPMEQIIKDAVESLKNKGFIS